jgi:ribosomal protein S25
MKKTIGTQSIDELFAKIDERLSSIVPDRPPNSVTALEYAEKRKVTYSVARHTLKKLTDAGKMKRHIMWYNGSKTNFYTLS